MPSLSFDPLASIYDATRGYTEAIAQSIAHELDRVSQANPQSAFLEVGVGTGRIALPLAALGHIYTGSDISAKMLAQFEGKLEVAGWQEQVLPWGYLPDEDTLCAPAVRRFTQVAPAATLRLVTSDIERLPFQDHTFDVIVAVHIFHLVDDWQQALREVVRVVRSGGVLLHCWDDYAPSGPRQITRRWREIVQELGGEFSSVRTRTKDTITDWLQSHGLQTETFKALTWEESVKPRTVLDSIAQRHWSSALSISDDIFALSIERLQQWVVESYGDRIDVEQRQERYFMIGKTRF